MKNSGLSICLIFVILMPFTPCFGQGIEVGVEIHARVDTTNPEVKEVANLWANYLNAQPDSIYDNPYWNNAEKLKFRSFDLSRAYMYPFPAKQLLHYYKPTILSIEKENENYSIRTIFAAEGLEGSYRKSNPWCITKLYAVKENGEWKLKNTLPIVTENWEQTTVGKITFIYPPEHQFDMAAANRANAFCDDIANEFHFGEWEPFDFYITKSGDEMGRLLNFDFFFAGYTTGVGMNENRILLSGLGSEFYPHEFVHLVVPSAPRHRMVEEGFATWKGGAMEKDFDELVHKLALELEVNDALNFHDILTKNAGWQISAFYTTGAVFCNAAYKKGGTSMVKSLLEIEGSDTELLLSILITDVYLIAIRKK